MSGGASLVMYTFIYIIDRKNCIEKNDLIILICILELRCFNSGNNS